MRRALPRLLATLLLSFPTGAKAESTLQTVARIAAGDPDEAGAGLAKYLKDPGAEVRSATLRAFLARAALKANPVDVAPLLADPVADIRDLASSVLVQTGTRAGCGKLLAEAFEGSPATVRIGLVPALAACDEAESRAVWGDSLGASDAALRAVADRTLRLASPDRAARAISNCIENGREANRLACVEFARDVKLTGALPSLARTAVLDFGAPQVKSAALGAVRAMSEDIDAAALAQKARESKDRSERAEALQILTLLPGDRTYVALTKALADPDEFVRQVAGSSLGEFGDLRAVGPLSKALDLPENARIRKPLQRALDRLTKK